MHRKRLRAGLVVAAIVAVTTIFPLAAAAGAWVEGPCDGSVMIDGTTYGPANDTPGNPIVVPDSDGLVADWQGSTSVVITDHSGWVGVRVGPAVISPGAWRWSGANDEHETSSAGRTSIDEARDLLTIQPVGIYEVRASHTGTGGSCTGMAMVRLEGNPLTNPVGGAAAAGTLAGLAGMTAAARGRKP